MLKMKRGAVIAALILAVCAAADDADPMASCDSAFANCNSRCDAMENAPAECYGTCDDTYQKCLDAANGYTPEPVNKSVDAKPAPTVAKPATKNAAALEGEDKGADPDGTGHEQ